MVCNPEAKFPCLMHASFRDQRFLPKPRAKDSTQQSQHASVAGHGPVFLQVDTQQCRHRLMALSWFVWKTCSPWVPRNFIVHHHFSHENSSFYVNMVITCHYPPFSDRPMAHGFCMNRRGAGRCPLTWRNLQKGSARQDHGTLQSAKLCLQKWRLRIAATSEGLAQQQHRYCPATLPRWWNMMPLCQSAAAQAAPALCRHCSKSQSQVSWEPKLEWNMFPA